jgi:hypothetical protein
MDKKKYTYDGDLPPRSDPNYMKIYRLKNRERMNKQTREYHQKKKEENPNYYRERYDPEISSEYRKNNRIELKEKQWKRRGIVDLTFERFESDIKKQNGLCKICGKEMKSPQADHDHNTGKYRSALCTPCNNGLGVYEKMKEKFEQYLKEHS